MTWQYLDPAPTFVQNRELLSCLEIAWLDGHREQQPAQKEAV